MESLPHNTEAEDGLIAIALLDGRIPQGAREVGVPWFYHPHNKAIWSAFLELDADGKDINHLDAFDIVKRDHSAMVQSHSLNVGDLVRKTHGVPAGHNEQVFVSKIKDAFNRRYAITELAGCIELLTVGDPDALRNLAHRIAGIESVTNGRGSWRKLSEIIEKEVKPGIRDLEQGVSHKIKTGWPNLDRLIGGGISLSDIILVAAPPGKGKSAFVLQIAKQLAEQGIGVGIAAGEMSDKENVYRLVSQSGKAHNLNSVDHLSMMDAEFYIGWADAVKDLPIYFDSRTSDMQTIGRSLRYLAEDCGAKVLVVDYVQLFKMNKFDKLGRYERITEVSIELKRLAMEYGIAVIEVAQFTKGAMGDKIPMLTDLENGTQLIKDISLGFIIDSGPDKEVTLRIAKGRNSGEASLRGSFDGPTLRFEF